MAPHNYLCLFLTPPTYSYFTTPTHQCMTPTCKHMSYQTNQMTTPSPVKIITSPITSHDYMPLSHDRGAVNINPQERDCHFYFYSTCSKVGVVSLITMGTGCLWYWFQGDGCKFRHASVALGSEVTCDLWRDSVCQRKICAFRHCTFDVSHVALMLASTSVQIMKPWLHFMWTH